MQAIAKFLAYVFAFVILLSQNEVFAEDKKKGDMNAYLKRTGQKFLQEVSEREGILKLKSGMLIEILYQTENENARSPTKFDSCDVTYKGTLKDGSLFDSGE